MTATLKARTLVCIGAPWEDPSEHVPFEQLVRRRETREWRVPPDTVRGQRVFLYNMRDGNPPSAFIGEGIVSGKPRRDEENHVLAAIGTLRSLPRPVPVASLPRRFDAWTFVRSKHKRAGHVPENLAEELIAILTGHPVTPAGKVPLTLARILDAIESNAGKDARRTAVRLLDLATECEAQLWPRREGVSVRLAGPLASNQKWLTLFVVSTAGTLYAHWLDRWEWAGVQAVAARAYRRGAERLFGDQFDRHPTSYASGVPLADVKGSWDDFEKLALRAVHQIHLVAKAFPRPAAKEIAAIEGLETEAKVLRKSRNSRLRREALSRANGVCAACEIDFGTILDGNGLRALQVHHRDQLAITDAPQLTTSDRLAVVCANCHAMIHADREAALPVESLLARWRRFRHPKRNRRPSSRKAAI